MRLQEALPRLAQDNLDDMLAAVGRGEVPVSNVIKAVYPDYQEPGASEESARVALQGTQAQA